MTDKIETTEFRLKSVTFEKDGISVTRQRNSTGSHHLVIKAPREEGGSSLDREIELFNEGEVGVFGDVVFKDTVLDRAKTLRDLLDKAINTEVSI